VLSKGDSPPTPQPETPPDPSRKLEGVLSSILIVDDVHDTLRMYERYFRFRGIDVQTAAEGAEALRLARARRPDVIVLDLAMPHMTGWDVLRDLKQGEQTRDIPVVVLSGQCAEESAMTVGADRYLEKPCTPETLFQEATRLVREPPTPHVRAAAPVQESFPCSTCRSDFLVEYYVERGAVLLTPIVVTCPGCAGEMRVTLKQPPLLFAIKCVGSKNF
jgi:CheY-like chemotaxis protein